ncbi:MAG: hypothetical protein ACWGNB_01850, partial [Thiogranum sp.]
AGQDFDKTTVFHPDRDGARPESACADHALRNTASGWRRPPTRESLPATIAGAWQPSPGTVDVMNKSL